MSDTKILSPCPFCGEVLTQVMYKDAFATTPSGTFAVCCDCGAIGPEGKTMNLAVHIWNTRFKETQCSS